MCAAIALYRDPENPDSFKAEPYNDPGIANWARRISLGHFEETDKPGRGLASRIGITLANGKRYECVKHAFEGMDANQAQDLARRKFDRLTSNVPGHAREKLVHVLYTEDLDNIASLFDGGA
ncbi:hypothetical protein [Shinella zoogloeoides]|uniref:hypothetical protein n=1 Tax=Shinella zoogloeoides TaxID=352475 RepID=UPI0028B1A905|nr:hypothetical protein [Shinella zoogloeoides]